MARMTTSNKVMMWAACGVAAVVIALTLVAVLAGGGEEKERESKGGGDRSTSPSQGPSYGPPEDWTEPEKWAALPRGKRTDDHDNQVGFPHTAEGAVAMLASANSTEVKSGHTMVDEQLEIFDSYMGKVDRTAENREKVKASAARSDRALRQSMKIPGEGAMPAGAYVRATVIGYKVIESSDDEVSVWLLSRVTGRTAETAKESGSYTRNVLAAHWDGDGKDWKMTTDATKKAVAAIKGQQRPTLAAPGDAAFNRAGWTAIRQAS